TGGEGLTEMLGVNAIQRRVVAHVREIHPDARDVVETLAGRLENRREILEDALRLGHDSSRHQLARRRVQADLAAEIDDAADVDGLRKRANRWGEFRRRNCGLAHWRAPVARYRIGPYEGSTKHEFLLFVSESTSFLKCIIITMIIQSPHDTRR